MLEVLAAVRGEDPVELAESIYRNTESLFPPPYTDENDQTEAGGGAGES